MDIPPVCSLRGAMGISEFYGVTGTAAAIISAGACRVALQFPDSLLSDAPAVSRALQAILPVNTLLFVLGDTTFAPCCVDEVAAMVCADACAMPMWLLTHICIAVASQCFRIRRWCCTLLCYPHFGCYCTLACPHVLLRFSI